MNKQMEAWLLTNALANHPEREKLLLGNEDAILAASEVKGGDSEKLDALIAQMSFTVELQRAIRDYLQKLQYSAYSILIIPFLFGILAPIKILSPSDSLINVLYVIMFCVFTPLMALLFWIVVSLFKTYRYRNNDHQTAAVALGVFGKVVSWLTRKLAELIVKLESGFDSNTMFAAGKATNNLAHNQLVVTWSVNMATHSGWFVFSLGAFLSACFNLIFYQYDFYWGSTIVSDETVKWWLNVIFLLPGNLTQISVDNLLINTSTFDDASSRRLWGLLLLASIATYGILPRIILYYFSKFRFNKAMSLLPSNFSLPFYREVLHQIKNTVQIETVEQMVSYPTPEISRMNGSNDNLAFVAFELDDHSHWPIHQLKTQITDLGHIQTSQNYQSAITVVKNLNKPVSIVAFCSFARSPDKTVLNRIKCLQDLAKSSVTLILVEASVLKNKVGNLSVRQEDWTDRALEHGIERVFIIDWPELESFDVDDFKDRIFNTANFQQSQ